MKSLSALMIVLGFFANHVVADTFEDYLNRAKEAYQQKDYELVKLELQDAITLANKQASSVFEQTFPDAINGWTAGKVTTNNQGFGGTVLSREYRQTGGKGRVTATLTHNSPIVANYGAIMNNPMLMQAEKVRVGRDYGVLKMENNDSRGELTMLVKSKYLIQLKGQQLSGREPLVSLLKGWDLKEIKAMAAD